MVDFTSILDKKAAEIEKPKPKPVGVYIATLVGLPTQRSQDTKDGERAILSFKIKPMMAKQVDDQAALEAAGDPGNWPPMKWDIWIDTPEGEYQLRNFLTATLGIDPGPVDNSKSLGEMCAESAGKQCVIKLKHRPYVDKNTQSPEIATDIESVGAV